MSDVILSTRKFYTPGWKTPDGDVLIYLSDDTVFDFQGHADKLQHAVKETMSRAFSLTEAGVIEVAENGADNTYYINHVMVNYGTRKMMCVAGPTFDRAMEKTVVH